MMNLRSLMTSESTTQNRSGHENIRKGRTASSRRFFTQPSPSGLACRLVLTLAVLLAGVNAAWGDEVELWTGSDKNVSIDRNTLVENLSSFETSDFLRIYTGDNGLTLNTNWSGQVLKIGTNISQGNNFNSTLGCYEIPLTDFKDGFPETLSPYGENFVVTSSSNITKITLASKPKDHFLNIAADGYAPTSNAPGEEISRELLSKEIDLSGASLKGVKYARIYLANDKGKAVAPTGLLSVKYGVNDATPAGTDAKNGFYIYNGGELTKSDISITLNAGAGNFTKYKIVALLSNDLLTATPSDGTSPLTQEPKWQEEYSYFFTYPADERIKKIQTELNSTTEKGENYIKFDYHEETMTALLGAFDKTQAYNEAGKLTNNWYTRWYVRNSKGEKQSLTVGEAQGTSWVLGINSNDWDDSGNGVQLSSNTIFNGSCSSGGAQQWAVDKMLGYCQIFCPSSLGTLANCEGYEIVFEASDECDLDNPNIKLRYIFQFPPLFTGKMNTDGVDAPIFVQTVANREISSVAIELSENALSHEKLVGKDLKYARFYLTDANGNAVNPNGKLTVSYSGGAVTTCGVAERGFYIYNSGGNLIKDNISVTLSAPKAYKTYHVVGLFSTELSNSIINEDNPAILDREPDWDLKYTYSFVYPEPTTKVVNDKTVTWSKRSMDVDASTSDPNADWGISFEELSVGQTVKWYVMNGTTKQPIELGSSRQEGKWTIKLNGPFTVSDNTAVLTDQSSFTSANWGKWGNPQVYAPSGKGYDDVKDSKIYCEVIASDDASATPYVRYEFSIIRSFLGELKESGKKDGESQIVTKTSTSETVKLGNALSAFSGTAKYARVWLAQSDGTMIEPTGLSVSGMTAFTRDTKFGFYVANNGGISLSDATLALEAGTYPNYQVYVALSSDYPASTASYARNSGITRAPADEFEPDYDLLYVFEFEPDFVAKNIKTVKTKFKTAMYNEGSRQTTVRLLNNWYEIAGDCNVSKSVLKSDCYVRWYLTDAAGNVIDGIDNLTSTESYTSLGNKYGYYIKGIDTDKENDYNPTITLKTGLDYNDVRVVCVATALSGDMNMPDKEPSQMQVKYVFSLMTQTELENAPFVHYVGESHRPYMTVEGMPGADEYSYDYETGAIDMAAYATQNIRQDVYKQDYYVYLDPNDGSAENLYLKLPMENWTEKGGGRRNATEPLGYFRWYDWATDKNSNYLEPIGTGLKQLNGERGLVALMISGGSEQKYRDELGVKFTGLSNLDGSKEILIACDVSRYMDGMDDSKTYLVHEPTLTMRYLYHILPASVIADAIDEKADLLTKVNDGTKAYTSLTEAERVMMYKTYEDNGRVVVSLNGTEGEFSLRADLQDLQKYFINNSGSQVQCSKMQWYCYYEDGDGLWKKAVSMGDRASQRLAKYKVGDFNGNYTKVGSIETKDVTIGNGTLVHLVGYIGNGSVEKAVIHYGLEFLNEKPQKLGEETAKRTDEYMRENLKLGNVLDFNNFFVDETTRFAKPTNSYENYAKIPMVFENAQYGFCYPQLYGQCASSWQIHHGGGWKGYGFAPTHGDYTILKSMNMPSVSASQNDDDQSIYTFWYNDGRGPLYDVTHERLDLGKTGNDAKYGSFLYVDASDEARTIAHLQFTAPLCAGSEIYYTAYIANMTGIAPQEGKPNTPSQTPPQVMFRVSMDVTEGGVTKRVPVVSFLTGDLYTVGATAGTTWYQVYGFTRIPKELENYVDGEEHSYNVSIDNYAENTDGADYAIDQISFFTSSAAVKVNQSSTPCDESSGVEVQIVAPAEELVSVVGEGNAKTFYYRIFEKKSDDPTYVMTIDDAVMGPYKNSVATDANLYGSAEFTANYDESTLPVGKEPEGGTTGFYKDSDDGKVYFQFDRREFNLKTGKTYFVSFYALEKTSVTGFEDWGGPYGNKLCSSMFSNDITPRLLKIDMESGGEASDGTVRLSCGSTSIDKSFLITVQYPTLEGYNPHEDVMFDFYMGSKAEFKAIKIGEGDNILYLERALDHMRQKKSGTINSSADLPTDYDDIYTLAMHNLLATYVDNGSLQLKATRTFSHTFTTANAGEQKFAAIPVTRHTSDGDICSPLEFVFNVTASSDAPKMELGFDDVAYPEEYTKRVVRVGLEQLNNMRKSTDSYKLHIPVSNYQNKGGAGIGNKLHFSNPYLLLSATNDPTATLNKKIAKVFDPTGGLNATDVYVNTNRMYLPLDFSGENCEVDFHEGYYYEAVLSFYDEADQGLGEEERCIGDLYLVFKIVPEFVTWNAREVGTGVYSGNWDDDKNWKRSTRAELYKNVSGNSVQQNTSTKGHPDGYDNNGEGSLNVFTPELMEGKELNPGFVPMKFTYVTMLGNNHSPSLFSEDYLGKIPGTAQQGGDLINPVNAMGTDTSPSGGSSNATDYVKYDMMVRYGEDGCKGHRYMKSNGAGGYVWNDDWNTSEHISSLTKVYDVEKFYGNVCKEIYFKPGAELRLQQRLKYEKAWVEEELEPNKWYLMSTPLKGTYAGDMYVPATAKKDYSQAGTPSVTGRQVTEAFQDITFDKSKGYSRTQYPFYQRSWGLDDVKVYTKTGDVRTTDYSAYLKFSTVSSNLLEWSHTYNDVQVPYNYYSGFAIRAKRKAMTNEAKALIRLPKADTSYDYYDWTDTSSEPAAGTTVKNVTKGASAYGRFVFDNTSANQEEWTIPLGQLQAQGTDEDGYTYYLVGNPFMASIDMGKFFGYQDGSTYYSYNEKLSPVYYIYKDGAATPVNATAEITAENKSERIIRPLQAFIVKCMAAKAPDNIVFNRWAITDGNYTDPTQYVPKGSQSGGNNPSGGTRALTLKAANGQGSSTASVNLSEAASDGYAAEEDATTLFDSNLSDVPVVYTVAGNKAVSIDTRSAIDIVPFGVACVASNELVSVKLSWSEERGVNRLYVLDAVTGEMTEVTDGQSVSVQPNDYGRYFLTTRGDLTAIREATAKGIVVSVRNKTVTVRSSEPLTTVRVMTTGGNVVSSLSNCGTEASIPMAIGGVYLVEAQTANNKKTMKVMVK